MCGMDQRALRVSTVVQLKVLQQLALRGPVRARPDTQGRHASRALQITHGMDQRVLRVSTVVQ
jgi:hypothetical protein